MGPVSLYFPRDKADTYIGGARERVVGQTLRVDEAAAIR